MGKHFCPGNKLINLINLGFCFLSYYVKRAIYKIIISHLHIMSSIFLQYYLLYYLLFNIK